ncbi:hypothetical protein HUE56_25910 (plasmid) [Azospirillum oryzae]|uniref:Uncharacterized protein n=1 Tax=Azospirillum oryzae TaxID=286727 RepID=A0A6N1ATX3_9PROT|nr:hypothetical protein [Azospirillum oryzae]KAA0587821.1 hypothetical protein FZ938_16670 [Azospirillum oryzae]QKS53937.1 hypothetical protein HUE56_25910 [Azospirillum oryzae]
MIFLLEVMSDTGQVQNHGVKNLLWGQPSPGKSSAVPTLSLLARRDLVALLVRDLLTLLIADVEPAADVKTRKPLITATK